MALAQLDSIHKVFDSVRAACSVADQELLARYRQHRDQEAFGSLVRRHGPMVLGVCKRVLRDSHAAEDAFQATFVVLAKKADAVRPPERLVPWLYGVAYRTAMKARGRAFRRQQVEESYAAETANRMPAHSDGFSELLPVIDEQLSALPEKYRAPLILCALQGLNKTEAAEKLGLPEGTVSSRLARAREMLRDRLVRRGIVVPAIALAALFSANALQAAVPTALAATAASAATETLLVSPAALFLSHEVLRSMTLFKLKALCVVAMCAALAAGGFGVLALQADEKKPTEKPATKPVEKPGDKKPDGEQKPGEKKPDAEKPTKPTKVPDGEKKPDAEKPAKPEKGLRFGGKVASVDAKESSIMVAVKGDGGVVEKLYPVAKDAKILVDGKEAKLADVPKNSIAMFSATAKKDGELPVISELRVTGNTFTGAIKEVSASTIALDNEKKPQSFKISSDTRVTVNGKDAKAADLKPGDKVTIQLKADESAALTITSGTGVKREGDKPKPEKGEGDEPAKPKPEKEGK